MEKATRRKRKKRCPTPLPPHPGVLHLLAVTALVLLPLAFKLPWWISFVAAGALLWRALVVLRGWPIPNAWLRTAMAVAGIAAVFAWYGRVNGLVAGAALLVVATALKLTELRDRRDLRILIALLYFTLLVNFLFSQALWTIVYLLGCTWLITAVLVESNHLATRLPRRVSLRLAAVIGGQAIPLMALLFILFPRIPGPLWGLPADSGAEPAGLSNTMSPGDIRKLVLSDAVAFRVRFKGVAPPPAQRYWRGPVLTHYDGRKWTPGFIARRPPTLRLEGAATSYRITLEPSRSRWLFALDLPDPRHLPGNAALNGNAVLVAARDNDQRRAYTLRSFTHYRLTLRLPRSQRKQNLQLPAHIDPKSRALARRWRDEGLSPSQIVAAALRMFANGSFEYTLEPPPTGGNAIDGFLFKTRRGFCEHFASSFTFLMRAAGIPARVVTGYQGGTRNPYGDYYVIRQDDAHAWSEVWLRGRGWRRVDPTAAASPMRIDDGLGAALAGAGGTLPAFLRPHWRTSWRHALQARWDWVNAQWNHFVLGYGPDLQRRFMSLLGLASWSAMILALTAGITLLLGLLALILKRGSRSRSVADAPLRTWQQATRKLRRHGLHQGAAEGPLAFTKRVCADHPELAPWVRQLLVAYIKARYSEPDNAPAQRALAAAARARLPKFVRSS